MTWGTLRSMLSTFTLLDTCVCTIYGGGGGGGTIFGSSTPEQMMAKFKGRRMQVYCMYKFIYYNDAYKCRIDNTFIVSA